MIDVDRPFRNQDPLDDNVRSGAEGSGVGTWDLDFCDAGRRAAGILRSTTTA